MRTFEIIIYPCTAAGVPSVDVTRSARVSIYQTKCLADRGRQFPDRPNSKLRERKVHSGTNWSSLGRKWIKMYGFPEKFLINQSVGTYVHKAYHWYNWVSNSEKRRGVVPRCCSPYRFPSLLQQEPFQSNGLSSWKGSIDISEQRQKNVSGLLSWTIGREDAKKIGIFQPCKTEEGNNINTLPNFTWKSFTELQTTFDLQRYRNRIRSGTCCTFSKSNDWNYFRWMDRSSNSMYVHNGWSYVRVGMIYQRNVHYEPNTYILCQYQIAIGNS